MDIISSDTYLFGNELFSSKKINYRFKNSAFLLYEVIRLMDGVFLFYEDHFERLRQGAVTLGVDSYLNQTILLSALRKLIKENKFSNGNIKVLFSSKDSPESMAAYYIPHSYPPEEAYRSGVDMITIKQERPQPQIKQIRINNLISNKLKKYKKNNEVYELLLVDHQNCVTEGSKSNFFLINNDKLYSAPPESILGGITRKYVLEIARNHSIKIVYKKTKVDELKYYKASFICGTSPKILPVRRVDDVIFNANDSIINLIKNEYNSIIKKYIESKQKQILEL